MKIRAIIFDLDNTIYPVKSVGEQMFGPLFRLIEADGNHSGEMQDIKDDIMRIPFQKVAIKYHFNPELTRDGIALLQELSYEGPMKPFDDYAVTKQLEADKYLVTTGFFKLQESKVRCMQLEQDFKEIHIVDPSVSARTKKDVFYDIMGRHGYLAAEILVIGDDRDAEIKAAQELGMVPVLYGDNTGDDIEGVKKIRSFGELVTVADL